LSLIINKTINEGATLVVMDCKNEDAPSSIFFHSKLEQQEYEKLTSEKRKRERAGILHLIHDILGIKGSLVHAPNGCPIIVDNDSPINISISHSNNLVGILLHHQKKVGLDIDDITRNFSRVASRFLSTKEKQYIPVDNLYQCVAWCAKEAVFKLAGESGIDFSQQIQLQPFQITGGKGSIDAIFISKRKKNLYPLNFEIIKNSCICTGVTY
jgi:phosphopantetheinyl transferase